MAHEISIPLFVMT